MRVCFLFATNPLSHFPLWLAVVRGHGGRTQGMATETLAGWIVPLEADVRASRGQMKKCWGSLGPSGCRPFHVSTVSSSRTFSGLPSVPGFYCTPRGPRCPTQHHPTSRPAVTVRLGHSLSSSFSLPVLISLVPLTYPGNLNTPGTPMSS